ncbi:MAG: HYR domain-containing protein, partial [Gammaproteobacteria bacterium]|nr:HYR domain-containing protein [Gammaproteobacteria bacterium]
NPLIMTSGKTTNPLIMTKDGSVNPLIMTRDDTANPLIMTRNDATNPLIMTRDINQNPLIMTRDEIGNPLIMTRDQFMNPLIMTRDGDGTRVMIPAGIFTGPLPEGYVEVTWLVENDGNTVTAYNAMPLVAGGDLLDSGGNLIPSQLIVTKPYLTYASRDCVPGMQVQNQIILNSVNPFQKNKDGSWSVDKGKATFLSAPGEETTVTLRVFDPTFNPRRLGFTVQSASCDSDKLNCSIAPLAAIEVDITPPGTPDITSDIPSPLEYLPAEGPEGTFAEWLAASTDNDGTSAAVSCVASFGDQTVDVFFDETAGKFSAVFPIGVISAGQSYTATIVTCTATDLSGNSSSANFEVLVLDKTPPELTATVPVPEPEATGPDGAIVNFSLSATDFGVGFTLKPETTSCSAHEVAVTPPLAPRDIAPVKTGDILPLGTWEVTCTGQDVYGNTGSTTFTVKVSDTRAPALVKPADIGGVEATSASGVPVSFGLPVATDEVGVTTNSCTPASGSTFPLGTTAVTCTAGDAAGNSASTGFKVTVVDTTVPSLAAIANITREAAGPTTVVTYATTATDLVSGALVATCTPASGFGFPVGTTSVTCSATDGAGNTGNTSFSVSITDTTAPSLATIANITKEATGPSTAVTYATIAVDAVSGSLPVMCTPASGASFVVGASTVTCSAMDGAGNTGTTSFSVTITDTTAPSVATIANITKEATGPSTVATYAPTATDLVSGSLPVTCVPASGSSFAVGTANVICSATDAKGNKGTMSFSVIITDKTPPVFGSVPNITAYATSPAGATVNYTVTANDLVSGTVTATCTPASPHTFALGSTTVSCTATDGSGNAATRTFTVTVGYAFIGLDLPNGMTITGGDGDTTLDLGETALGTFSRSIPLYWRYGDMNGPIASGTANPMARIERFGQTSAGACNFLATPIAAEDSGNSAMRYTASSQSWKFNWQPSAGAGCYGITIRSGLTGQSDGPYLFQLR